MASRRHAAGLAQLRRDGRRRHHHGGSEPAVDDSKDQASRPVMDTRGVTAVDKRLMVQGVTTPAAMESAEATKRTDGIAFQAKASVSDGRLTTKVKSTYMF